MIFLTDGNRHWLGPYSSQCPVDIARGERWLREVEGATDVWTVRAATIEAARRKLARVQRERK